MILFGFLLSLPPPKDFAKRTSALKKGQAKTESEEVLGCEVMLLLAPRGAWTLQAKHHQHRGHPRCGRGEPPPCRVPAVLECALQHGAVTALLLADPTQNFLVS